MSPRPQSQPTLRAPAHEHEHEHGHEYAYGHGGGYGAAVDLDDLATLAPALRALHAARNPEAIARIACEAARALCKADGALWVRSEQGIPACVHASSDTFARACELGASCGVSHALRSSHPFTSSDLHDDPRFSQTAPSCAHRPLRALLSVPLAADNEPNALVVYWLRPQPVRVEHQQLAVLVADAADAALAHDAELKRTEEQLQVAQRMDAIGQLAGGIAHDFNNLLSIILSYAGFVADEVQHMEAVAADVEEIRQAGTRAATLTRQLLAFGRKQVIAPQVLDLSRLAGDLERLLRRVVGKDIEVVHHFAPDLGSIKADPIQLEQMIMNLVLNARDVMPDGGTLTLCTRNVDSTMALNASVPPGRWVELTVTDTGTGMDEVTKARVFEPFFTTKESGKGTGLGLSIVHGIVTQSGGRVRVDSEPGRGTTFSILLPQVSGPAEPVLRRPASLRPPVGNETVLLVEGDPAVRGLVARILLAAGYDAVVAANSAEAVALCDARGGRIDLLVTDVAMPRLSGKQLAQQLRRRAPELRVLYTSGYSNGAQQDHSALEADSEFIAKPFSASQLRRKVRDVLDAECAPPIEFVGLDPL